MKMNKGWDGKAAKDTGDHRSKGRWRPGQVENSLHRNQSMQKTLFVCVCSRVATVAKVIKYNAAINKQ